MVYRFLKRTFDICASSVGLILLSPLFILISIAIKVTSKGPIYYRQERIGINGKPFRIYKFRSMRINSDKGMQITVKGDNRITSVGRFIRKFKIDELPQLFNVLSGKMSLVGPRPEVPKYVELYNDEQRQILSIKPGITDLASIEFKDENQLLDAAENPEQKYIEEIMPIKLTLNLEYMQKRSFFYDIGLIFKTIWRVIR